MATHLPNKFPQTALYKKAEEIFALSRRVSEYLVHDLARLKEDGTEDPHVYFTGDIVQQSTNLAPEILKAESQLFSEAKHKHAASVARLTNLLYKNCERLEHSNSNGKEFLNL